MAAATVAPIAIINVAHIGCDAILVDKRGWRPLKLPKLSFMDIFNHARFLVWRGLIDYKLLEWMWDTVAEPVLTALEIKGAPCDGCPWPRVQWILTGLLTGFPMHAAGYHSRTSSADTVIDRVISSYSSTLQAIIQNLKRSSDQTLTSKRTQVWKVAAVGAVAKDLQGVANEMRMLASQGKHLDVERVEPRAAEVSHALQQCDMFHFAGHGYLDATTPLQSGLILDGAERLTLADICGMKLHTRCPLLAYLSACGTGRTRDEALLDESMHLISGFQLAGFRHVIGTLWNVRDEVCVEVSKSVYGWMRNHSMSDDSVGEGLHHTLRSRRDASVLGGLSKADASPQFELIKAARESMAAESRSGHWKGMMRNGMGFDGLGMDFLQLGGSESTLDDGMGRDIIPRRQEQFKGFGLDWVPFIHSGS